MQRFRFSLSRVLEWRRQELMIKEDALGRMTAERISIEKARQATVEEEHRLARQAAASTSVFAEELAAFDAYRLFLQDRRRELAGRVAQCDERIDRQRQEIIEARRQMKLLERLEQKQREEWRREWDHEQESVAGELFLARWNSRPSSGT
ncbi:MAG: hypothetical protein ACKV22_30925 [Bryobacteraceae bacterium]